jgi:hypothetical protein
MGKAVFAFITVRMHYVVSKVLFYVFFLESTPAAAFRKRIALPDINEYP